MRQTLEFTVFGQPAPQGSKNLYRGRLVEASKKVGPWRIAVKDAVFRAWIAESDERPFVEPVEIRSVFYLPRPKTVKREYPSVPPDLDKLERGLFDALTQAGVWTDDALVVRSQASKLYADRPEDAGVRVFIRTIQTAEDNSLATNK